MQVHPVKTSQRPRRTNEHQLPCVTCHKTEDAWWGNCKLFGYTSRNCCNACRIWAKNHPETPRLPVRHSMLTAQMRQLETELINKDLGAEASPEKVAAVIAAQVETSHTHENIPVQMQPQEQKEPREGGNGLPGTDSAMHLAEDNQLRRLSLEASQVLSAQDMLSQSCQLLLLSQLHFHIQQQQLLSSQAIIEKQQQQLLQQEQQMEQQQQRLEQQQLEQQQLAEKQRQLTQQQQQLEQQEQQLDRT